MEKKVQEIYVTYYHLLIAQDLLQTHNQIVSIIFLKKFIELNVSSDTIIKNVKLGISYKYCYCFFEYTNFKDDLIESDVCVVTKIINTSLTKS